MRERGHRIFSCAVFVLALVSGCASGATGDGPSVSAQDAGPDGSSVDPPPAAGEPASDAGSAVATALQASVSYPFLIPDPNGSADSFPTVFAHLLGQTLDWTDISTSLACFTHSRTGSRDRDSDRVVDAFAR